MGTRTVERQDRSRVRQEIKKFACIDQLQHHSTVLVAACANCASKWVQKNVTHKRKSSAALCTDGNNICNQCVYAKKIAFSNEVRPKQKRCRSGFVIRKMNEPVRYTYPSLEHHGVQIER